MSVQLHRSYDAYKVDRTEMRLTRSKARGWVLDAWEPPEIAWLADSGLTGASFPTLRDARKAIAAAVALRPLPATEPVTAHKSEISGRYLSPGEHFEIIRLPVIKGRRPISATGSSMPWEAQPLTAQAHRWKDRNFAGPLRGATLAAITDMCSLIEQSFA